MAIPDATLLSWITAEVNQALCVVREQIARFRTQRADPALLRSCPEHLHQVSGALRMVGLNGATRFCEAIEAGFAGLGGAAPDEALLGVLDRATAALQEFVEDLERGQPDAPLRLYPVYRELARLHGGRDGGEKDLFYPDVSLRAPVHPQACSVAPEERASRLLAGRAMFQRGLLCWLRGGRDGLGEMARALEELHRMAAALPEPHALWWAARALLEAMEHAPAEADWLPAARALCNRIDFHIRDLARGEDAAGEALLRELLYAVATSPRSTPLAAEVRRFYDLDGLFPPPAAPAAYLELNSEWLEAALYDLHSRLEALKSAWVHYVAGEQKTAARFRELVTSFKAKARELGNRHLIKMLDAIAVVAKRLPDPYPQGEQLMVIEMASAFLLVESVIDHFTSPPADLEQQIVLLGGWLLDSAEGKASAQPPAGLRGDLVQRIGALQLRTQVAKEIVANLRHMEQVLDGVARDPAKRPSAAALKPLMRQVHGALAVIGLEYAGEVMTRCEGMLDAYGSLEDAAAGEELDWIAEGLSSLGFYLDPCLGGREPAKQAIDLFFQRLAHRQRRGQEVRAVPASAEEGVGAAQAARPAVDGELLAIFLDEAAEVLGIIRDAVSACQAPGGQADALVAVRRGFHTLKGSGRMVGLMDLGEVAWEMEQLLNLWLEQKRGATATLLEVVGEAAQSFSKWLEALRAGNLAGEIEAQTLVEAARRLRSEPQEPEEVTVGGTTLARAFFDIYVKEAAEHVGTLEREFAAWRAQPGMEASPAFMRAAHTLASSSGTAGFSELAALAAAIEQWVPFASHTKDPADAQSLDAAIARLRAMVGAVARHEVPGDAAEQAGSLKALAARLGTGPARRLQLAPPAREQRVLRDDIDRQLLGVFLEESQELLPAIGADLRRWKADRADAAALQSLQRSLHTLKGSARMAGAIRLGELAHRMESRIEEAVEAQALSPGLFSQLEEELDRLATGIERLRQPAPRSASRAEAPEAPRPAAAMLRISADVVDHLINEAGEVSIGRSRVEAELRAMRASLADLSESVARLRAQLREVEVQADSQMQSRLSALEERAGDYDPLEFDRYTRLQELTRLMAESLHDVFSVQQGLVKSLGETDAALVHQARAGRGVQQELMRMRAVPFASLGERLHRVVRQTARELGKTVDLEIDGAQLELDRSVLERVAAPLEHMLRNAVAHGLETAEARASAGKPATGRIAINLRQEANEMTLVIADDGAGIDADRLLARAIEKGLVAADARPSEDETLQLIFSAGLSTAQGVSELAGRGVGMAVVRNEIAAIGGRIDIASTRGQGTTFTVYLPLTLAVTQAVLVRAAGGLFAVSTAMVEQVLRLKSDAMASLYAAKQVEFNGRAYPLQSLRHLLEPTAPTEVETYNSVLLLRSGVQRIALHVDELAANQEVVVKPIGPQLARVAWMTGATVLGDGTIVPIINPVVLASRSRAAATQFSMTTLVPQLMETVRPDQPLIMVVDDSLTVRKVTTRLLEREGYQVISAKDGLDALEQLRGALPALMLVDIEMPRMDGFDLTRSLRNDERTRDIPILIVSSRTAEKHRSHAAALGVNAFLGKPYDEGELLRQVRGLLATPVH